MTVYSLNTFPWLTEIVEMFVEHWVVAVFVLLGTMIAAAMSRMFSFPSFKRISRFVNLVDQSAVESFSYSRFGVTLRLSRPSHRTPPTNILHPAPSAPPKTVQQAALPHPRNLRRLPTADFPHIFPEEVADAVFQMTTGEVYHFVTDSLLSPETGVFRHVHVVDSETGKKRQALRGDDLQAGETIGRVIPAGRRANAVLVAPVSHSMFLTYLVHDGAIVKTGEPLVIVFAYVPQDFHGETLYP